MFALSDLVTLTFELILNGQRGLVMDYYGKFSDCTFNRTDKRTHRQTRMNALLQSSGIVGVNKEFYTNILVSVSDMLNVDIQ